MDIAAATPLRLALVTALFDNAAMYPPAQAPMEAALALHATVARSPWAAAQGRFLCPAGQLPRLADQRDLLGLTAPLEVDAIVGSPADPGVTVDLGAITRAVAPWPERAPDVRLAAVEYRPADQSPAGLTAAASELAELTTETGDALALLAVEVTIADADDATIIDRVDAVARSRETIGDLLCAKVRCGGRDRAMVPSAAALATFVTTCAEAGLPFKATAGLHHGLAVSRGSKRRHGYLNLLAATAAALQEHDTGTVADALVVADPDDVTATADALRVGPVDLDLDTLGRTRRDGLWSLGTCSLTDPIADLLALT